MEKWKKMEKVRKKLEKWENLNFCAEIDNFSFSFYFSEKVLIKVIKYFFLRFEFLRQNSKIQN